MSKARRPATIRPEGRLKALGDPNRSKFASDGEHIRKSVRKHHAGLHSFRSMRRMEARRRKASALRSRHFPILGESAQRPSQARVRSTISAWQNDEAFGVARRTLDDLEVDARQNAFHRPLEIPASVASVGVELNEEREALRTGLPSAARRRRGPECRRNARSRVHQVGFAYRQERAASCP